MSDGGLTPEEQAVMNKINDVYNGILDLGLNCNEAEFAGAIHTLQGFVKQRALHRIYGNYWNDWFGDDGEETIS
jgi:hypothetical protein